MKTVPASMLIALGLSGLVAAGVASLLVALPEPEGDLLLVIVPPWRATEAIVQAGGGQIVGPIRAPLSVLVSGGDAARMEAAGALWVADGQLAARLCGLE